MHCVCYFLVSYCLKWGATKLTKSTQMYQSSACHFCLVYPESFITSVIYFYWVPYPGRRQWEAHRETIKSDAVVSSSGCKRNRKRCYKRFVSICWTCTFPIRCLCHHRKKLRLYTIQTSFEYEPLFVWLKFITLWFVLFNYCVPLTQQLLSLLLSVLLDDLRYTKLELYRIFGRRSKSICFSV